MSSPWHQQETYKGRITLSVEAIRIILAINGGAAIAILTFWGHASAEAHYGLRCSLLSFGLGVVLAALTALVAYIAQAVLYEEAIDEAKPKTHHHYINGALWLAVGSIAAFAAGITFAGNALATWNAT